MCVACWRDGDDDEDGVLTYSLKYGSGIKKQQGKRPVAIERNTNT